MLSGNKKKIQTDLGDEPRARFETLNDERQLAQQICKLGADEPTRVL